MRTIIIAAFSAFLGAGGARAGTIGFEEEFALAGDRAKALEQLIPGTEDYYYYHCLHFQNTGRLDKADGMLKTWIQRHGRTGRVVEIENRQALLRYADDAKGTLAYLARVLKLRFDHQKEVAGARPDLPTRLDPALLEPERLARRALERHPRTLDGFEDRGLARAAAMRLDPERRRHLLRRLERPDLPGLVDLVLADLGDPRSGPFGSLPIHGRLLREQLDGCLRRKPDLLNENAFVRAYAAKLRPGPDVDWRTDRAARQAYLERLWGFVARLGPSHNSLKAHVLYHRLAHDRAQGVYDRDRFLAYLKLPRKAPHVNRKYLEAPARRAAVADLRADFRALSGLPPVGDDEPLVRDYLDRFLRDAEDTKPFDTYLDPTYVRYRFAETKIVHGIGDMERWAALLPPERFRALKERVDLDFVPTNKTVFGVDEQVGLELFVKNAPTLLIKIFRIDTLRYYRATGREIDTAIDLDGLVPNEERTLTFEEPPLRRVRRRFEFPELAGRGVYVIDFIGNGKSSRALVRKGALRYVARTSAAGQVVTVFDEAGRPLRGASLYLGGHRYAAEADGTVLVPFSTAPGRKSAILEHGGFASLAPFSHQGETYRLEAGIHVEREALLAGRTAHVIVRPQLTLNGTPMPPALLTEPKLVIATSDQEGITATKEVAGLEWKPGAELRIPFQVPRHLARIAFTLSGEVKSLTRDRTETLRVARVLTLNAIDKTEKIEDLHLARAGGRYVLEVRGRTGEAKPDRPVVVALKHEAFRDPVEATLKTDDAGRVELGPLDGIAWVKARGPEGTEHTWPIARDRVAYPGTLHGPAGEPLRVPYAGAAAEPTREAFSLLELRGGIYVRDRFDALRLADGYLVLQGLPAGDYELVLKESGTRILVRLTAGPAREGYRLGPARWLEASNPSPLAIRAIEVKDDALTIRLAHADAATRVHVVATRYLPAYPLFDDLAVAAPPGPAAIPVLPPESRYVIGRDIGDEYRYILERKLAEKFPGNMLPRPTLLLNPWALRTTETGRKEARAGEAFRRAPQRRPGGRAGGRGAARRPAPAAADFADLEFLGEPGAVLANLKPDARGIVTVPRKALGAHAHVRVIALRPGEAVSRSVSLPETPMTFRDLRLREGLEPGGHFIERREVTVVPAGGTFRIADTRTAEFQMYDTVPQVYGLFRALSGDATLAEFAFIARWPKLAEEEKRALYAKYACHELNFFLSRKDPGFFEAVVKPYIANKFHKTFLDRWLVGAPLAAYRDPWAYRRLNLVERILLGRRIAAERPLTARHVRDLFALAPRDTDRLNRLFETALRGRALEAPPTTETAAAERPGEPRVQLAAKRAESRARKAGLAAPKPAAPPAPPGAEGKKALEDRLARRGRAEKAKERLAEGEARQLQERAKRDLARRATVRRLYRAPETTKEWAETNYWRLPIERETPDRIPVNAFWRDYAVHAGDGPFISGHVAEASGNFTEMMFALAVLDLPFEAGAHGRKADGAALTIRAATPLLVYHKQIRPARPAEGRPPILVSQNLYRYGERYRQVGDERVDNFVTGPLLAQTPYGCQVVVTNPTSSKQKLEVLLQVPAGAVPIRGTRATRSIAMELEPYRTWTTDFFFYFPEPGIYGHFPVHVARDEALVAFAPPARLTVVAEPKTADRASWAYVSQHGTNEEVLRFLREENLERVKLEKIAWRMRDRAFFREVIACLRDRHVYDATLWAYGIHHNEPEAIRAYLRHAEAFVRRCGPALQSPLLVIDPVERRSYQHLEYEPLVNARAHRLGPRRAILNDRFFAQYRALMRILCAVPRLADDDRMSVIYYLLLQDRVGEALRFFRQVKPQDLASTLQYDYFDAYLALSTENLRRARTIADRYADHPVRRWRERFARVRAQLDEIAGAAGPPEAVAPESPEAVQGALAATEPAFDVRLEGRRVTVTYRNLRRLQVRYYLMDLELLFSRNPFVGSYAGQFAAIEPNETADLELPAEEKTFAFTVPEKYGTKNVLIEFAGAGQTRTLPFFASELAVQLIENYAQLRVLHARTGKPLGKVYVKVYARMRGGAVRFYKDGYTDLRGRFDYGALSTNDLPRVERFAILLLSEAHGAVVREAAPPAR